jgi:hypothetical protein
MSAVNAHRENGLCRAATVRGHMGTSFPESLVSADWVLVAKRACSGDPIAEHADIEPRETQHR